MAKIIVFNNDTDRMETYYRNENEAMPYNNNRTLTVGEFRGSSNSPTLWTTKRAMQSFNTTRFLFGAPIPVGFAFKRPWEGGHGTQSQHYAGVAFDAGQVLSNSERNRLRNVAIGSRSLELCGNINIGFQNNMIIEERLSTSCIHKIGISKRIID